MSEMKLGHRIALTFLIVLVILFALAAFGYFTGGWDAEGAPRAAREGQLEEPEEPKYNDRMRAIEREAADEAYRDRLVHLFVTWMRDEAGQPGRAIQGARQARHAYIAVMDAIDARDKSGKSGSDPGVPVIQRPYRPDRPER